MENILQRIDSSTSPYKILGISHNSSNEEVNIVFKKLALICHPDKSSHPRAENTFKIINNARNNILREPTSLEELIRKYKEIFKNMDSEYEESRLEREKEYEQKRSFIKTFGYCSDDQWRDNGTGGWDVLPRKTQNKNRKRH